MLATTLKFKLITILLFASAIFNNSYSQVTITAPSLFDTATCVFPTPYVTLDDIVITENAPGDFATTGGTTKTLILTAPANFSFFVGTGSVSGLSADITNLSISSFTANKITITLRVVTTTTLDVVTISGIQVRGNGPSAPGSELKRDAASTSVITGDGTGTPHAYFTTIAKSPVITVQPDPRTICANDPTTFSVSASGSPTYQWQEDQGSGFVNLIEGFPYSAVANQTLTITGVVSMSGYQYRCEVTGTDNVCNSDSETLTVNPPPEITAGPFDTTVCVGNNASFFVETTGSSLNYTWKISVDTGSSFTTLAIAPPYSQSGNSLLITNVPASFNKYQYHCSVSDGNICGADVQSTTPGILTVNPSPTIAAAGPDQVSIATCGLTLVTLAANAPTIGTGSWSISSGLGGNITTTSSPTSTFTGTVGTTYVLRWTISNLPCDPSLDSVTITFNQAPTTANAGPDQTGAPTCGLTSVTLAGNSPAIGTGNWTVFSGTGGSFVDAADPFTTFSGISGNTYVLRWTTSNAPCTPSIDSVTIKFNSNPTPAAAGPDQTGAATCELTSVTLAANNPLIGTGSWSIFTGAGGAVTTPSSPTSDFTGTTGTTYQLIWTISNAPCANSNDTVTITFNQNPSTAAAGPDQTGAATCGLTSVTLAGNTPIIGTGNWSVFSGLGGAFVLSTDPTTDFSGTAGATYELIWTISNVPCIASTDTVTIKFNLPPTTAVAGPPQATCGVASVTLAANTPTAGTGTWSIFSGTGGTVTTPSSPTSTFTGISGNTYVLRWTITNPPCGISIDSVTIIFNQTPTTAAAGPDQTGVATCGLTSVTLAGNAPSIGTGNWSVFSGLGGAFVLATDPTTDFSGAADSTYVLVWTISNAPCDASTDTVIITFNQNPTTSNAGTNQTGAATCGLTSVTLAGNTPIFGTGTWIVFSGSGGTFTDPSSPTSDFSGNTGSSYILVWTISNAPCVSIDNVTITFNQNPTTADAGPDQTGASTCGITSVPLAANPPTIGTGNWSVFSGAGGTVTSPTIPTSAFTGTPGTAYILIWTITNTPCVSTDTVAITFNQNTTIAAAGPDQSDSATCGLISVTLAANKALIGTGNWSIFSGTGGAFVDATDSATVFNGIAGNAYVLVWTISNVPCSASSDTVLITFNISPTIAAAGPDQTNSATCGFTAVTLAANPPTTGTGNWSIFSGTGGNFVDATDPISVFTGTAGATYVLIWTISNAPCISTDSVTVTFNEFPTPAAAGIDQTLCGATTTLAANTATVGTGSWSIFSGAGGSFIDASSPTSIFNGIEGDTYVLIWTISNAPCPVSTDSTTIIFYPQPTVLITNPPAVCSPDTVNLTLPAVTAGSTGGLTFTYFTDAAANNVMADTLNVLLSGTYYIVGTTSLGCADTTAVAVSVDATAVGGSVSSDAFVCSGANGDTLTLSGHSGAIQKWQYSVNGGTTWIDTANTTTEFIYSNITVTTWYRALISEFCADAFSIEARITVDTSPMPIGGTVTANDTVCSGLNNDTLILSGHFGTVTRWESSIDDGTTWVYINDSTTSLIYTNLTTTTIFHAIVQNGNCNTAVSSNDTITVNPVSNAGTISGALSGCAFVTGSTLSLSGYTGDVINWQYSVDSGTTWIDSANTTASYVYAGLTDTTFYRAIVKSGVCVNDTTDIVEVNIYPKPVAQFTADTTCFGGTTTFTNTSTVESGFMQYYQWDFGDNSSSVLLNPTHTYTVAGANTVNLITTSDLGCLDTATVGIFVNPLPNPQIIATGPLSFCCGGSLSISGIAGLDYVWSTSETTQSIVVNNCQASGVYSLTVTDPSTLCTNSSSVSIVIFSLPVAFAGNDTTISLGSSYILNGLGGTTYSWSPATGLSNPDIASPLAGPLATTTYELTVLDNNGCSDIDSLTITVIADFNVTLQNLMTANGDGYNDKWIIKNVEHYPGTEVIIVNREGQQVFYSSSYDNSWTGTNKNGQPLPDGTYYYFIKFKNSDKMFKGPLTILNE